MTTPSKPFKTSRKRGSQALESAVCSQCGASQTECKCNPSKRQRNDSDPSDAKTASEPPSAEAAMDTTEDAAVTQSPARAEHADGDAKMEDSNEQSGVLDSEDPLPIANGDAKSDSDVLVLKKRVETSRGKDEEALRTLRSMAWTGNGDACAVLGGLNEVGLENLPKNLEIAISFYMGGALWRHEPSMFAAARCALTDGAKLCNGAKTALHFLEKAAADPAVLTRKVLSSPPSDLDSAMALIDLAAKAHQQRQSLPTKADRVFLQQQCDAVTAPICAEANDHLLASIESGDEKQRGELAANAQKYFASALTANSVDAHLFFAIESVKQLQPDWRAACDRFRSVLGRVKELGEVGLAAAALRLEEFTDSHRRSLKTLGSAKAALWLRALVENDPNLASKLADEVTQTRQLLQATFAPQISPLHASLVLTMLAIQLDMFADQPPLSYLFWRHVLASLLPDSCALRALTISQARQLPALSNCSSLGELTLVRSEVPDLSPFLAECKHLRTLSLSEGQGAFPKGLAKASELRVLNLPSNALKEIPNEVLGPCDLLPRLTVLSLANNELQQLPPELFTRGTELQHLDLSGNKLYSLPQISDQAAAELKLVTLYLSNNELQALPSWTAKLAHLQRLFLAQNRIKTCPPHVLQLSQLHYLDLADNFMTVLPWELGRLKHLEFVAAQNNPELHGEFKGHGKTLAGFLRQGFLEMESCDFSKLVTMGKGRAGKTTLVNSLRHLAREEKKRTAPVVVRPTDAVTIESWKDKDMNWQLRDCPGQTEYSSTNLLFLDQDAVVLLCLSLNDAKEECQQQLTTWMTLLNSRSKQKSMRVIIVGTRDDDRDEKTRAWFDNLSSWVSHKFPEVRVAGYERVNATKPKTVSKVLTAVRTCAEQLREHKLPSSLNRLRKGIPNLARSKVWMSTADFAKHLQRRFGHSISQAESFLNRTGDIISLPNLDRVLLNLNLASKLIGLVVTPLDPVGFPHGVPAEDAKVLQTDLLAALEREKANNPGWLPSFSTKDAVTLLLALQVMFVCDSPDLPPAYFVPSRLPLADPAHNGAEALKQWLHVHGLPVFARRFEVHSPDQSERSVFPPPVLPLLLQQCLAHQLGSAATVTGGYRRFELQFTMPRFPQPDENFADVSAQLVLGTTNEHLDILIACEQPSDVMWELKDCLSSVIQSLSPELKLEETALCGICCSTLCDKNTPGCRPYSEADIKELAAHGSQTIPCNGRKQLVRFDWTTARLAERTLVPQPLQLQYGGPAATLCKLWQHFFRNWMIDFAQLRSEDGKSVVDWKNVHRSRAGLLFYGTWTDNGGDVKKIVIKRASGIDCLAWIKGVLTSVIVPPHPRLNRLLGLTTDPALANAAGADDLDKLPMLVLERAMGGPLIANTPEVKRKSKFLQICRDVLEGLQFLHENGVIHRDLSVGNVMLDQIGKAMLIDFEQARPQQYKQRSDAAVQMAKQAPESMNDNKREYSTASDMWTFGCFVHELWTGEQCAYNGNAWRAAVESGQLVPPLPADLPLEPPLRKQLERCFAFDPSKRPTALQLLQAFQALVSVPRAPVLQAERSENSVVVRWQCDDGGDPIEHVELDVEGKSFLSWSPSFTFSNVDASSNPKLRVRAKNSLGYGDWAESAAPAPPPGADGSGPAPMIISES